MMASGAADRPCPFCNAGKGEPCRTAGGNIATSEHVDRLIVVRTPRQLERKVLAATTEAHWITAVDAAAVDLALTIARKIDDAVWLAETKAASTLFVDAPLGKLGGGIVYDVQTLQTILTSLGLTPRGRSELHITEPETHDELADVVALYND